MSLNEIKDHLLTFIMMMWDSDSSMSILTDTISNVKVSKHSRCMYLMLFQKYI